MQDRSAKTYSDKAAVKFGEFPFPLTHGTESEYLTWLRDHSNYMAARGFLDYLRSVAVLVRGIIVNFLTLLPYLLIAAIALAYAHHWMLGHPYFLTRAVFGFAVVWIVFFLVMIPLFKIAKYRTSLKTGSESTVRQRDLYERSFSAVLLAILAVAFFETLPWVLEFFHEFKQKELIGWRGTLATIVAVLALFTGSDKLLTVLGGVMQKLVVVLIGLAGLLVPLAVILYVTDFLVYGPRPSPYVMFSPLVVPVIAVIGIIAALLVGRRAFRWKEYAWVTAMLVSGVLLSLFIIWYGLNTYQVAEENQQWDVEDMLQPLDGLASQLKNIPNEQELTPAVARLVSGLVEAQRDLKMTEKAVESEKNRYWAAIDEKLDKDDLEDTYFTRLDDKAKWAEWDRQLYTRALQLVSVADKLAKQSEEDLNPLRRQIGAVAHRALLEKIRAGAREYNYSPDRFVADSLRRAWVDLHLFDPDFIEDLAFEAFASGFDDTDEGEFNSEQLLAEVERRYKHVQRLTFGSPGNMIVSIARDEIDNALGKLGSASIKEILAFVDETRLFETVKTTFATLPGTAELARARGEEELAKLLPKDELLTLAMPQWFDTTNNWLEALPFLEVALPQPSDPFALEKLAWLSRSGTDQQTRIAEKAGIRLLQDILKNWRGEALQRYEITEIVEGFSDREPSLLQRLWDYLDALFENMAAGAQRLLENLVPQSAVESRLQWEEQQVIEKGVDDLHSLDLRFLVELAVFWLPQYEREIDIARDHLNKPRYAGILGARARHAVFEAGYALQQRQARLLEVLEQRVFASTGRNQSLLDSLINLRLIDAAIERAESGADINFSLGSPDHHYKLNELARIAVIKFVHGADVSDAVTTNLMFGSIGRLHREQLGSLKKQLFDAVIKSKVIFVALLAVVIWLACWFTVDINLTSIHGLYRDRLSATFLVGKDTKGDIQIEEAVDLAEICRYDALSTAPYHLINVALNLQGSADAGVRDRQSAFFVFSKLFTGGRHTGYCRSETMEQVFPQMSLGAAMAISAAAASPNMGRGTSPLLVAFMTLLNIRLGYWVPNPGLLEDMHNGRQRRQSPETEYVPGGFSFDAVFVEELKDLKRRWSQVYKNEMQRPINDISDTPTTENRLVGLGFSGGGIRSATINLGIAQVLYDRGIFDHVDYMSTVSGGGYLGSGISALMRTRERPVSKVAGTVTIETGPASSLAAKKGQVVVVRDDNDVEVARYHYSGDAQLEVANGDRIDIDTPLLMTRHIDPCGTFGDRFRWRVRPTALLREVISKLDEKHRWVNVSDGGHIENLAAMELLRRRCKYIILGDGEADPQMHFNGLANLMRCAYIDLAIEIDIDLDALRLRKAGEDNDEPRVSAHHWAIGQITYPPLEPNGPTETGYLLYLKSSFTGDESEVIREYRHRNPTFPHQSTADQFFDEGQFEAYRALGQHIAELAVDGTHEMQHEEKERTTVMTFASLEKWFERLWNKRGRSA